MTGAQHLADALREQAQDWKRSRKGAFHLRISDEEAREVIADLSRVIPRAEPVLDDFAQHFSRPFVRYDADMRLSLVTKARCPTRAKVLPRPETYITRVFDIGHHIPEERFEGVLESLDHRLSNTYKPRCTFCPHGKSKKSHPTVLSFVRYIPEDMGSHFRAIDDAERDVNRRRYDAAITHDPDVARFLDDDLAILLARQELLGRAAKRLGHALVMTTTRHKGDDRRAQRILRTALGISNGKGDDTNGAKFIANGDIAAEYIAQGITSTLLALGEQADYSGLLTVSEGHSVWSGRKIRATYTRNGVTIPISVHVQTPEEYWADVADHPFYEERQLALLDAKREEGWPVDQMYREVVRVLAGKIQS